MVRAAIYGARLLLTAIVVLLLAAAAATCAGCGGSQIRAHATAASIAMVAMQSSGDAIDLASREAARACHDTACIDDVTAETNAAGGARDALIPVVHAYRDAVLIALDAEESPALIDALIVVALRVAREWDAMREALAALGVTVPPIPFPVPGGAQ